jgi:hypothetical protein
MEFITRDDGYVALCHLGRCFYADDGLPDRNTKARDLDGLDELDADLLQRWLTQKRQRSSGPQYARERKSAIGVKVSSSARDALQAGADARQVPLSTFAAQVIESWAAIGRSGRQDDLATL